MNEALYSLTAGRYFEALPVAEIASIVEQAGAQSDELNGIYCGQEGRDTAQVAPNCWMRPCCATTILVLCAFQAAGYTDSLPWNIPTPLRPSIETAPFNAEFEIGTWLNPFYLRGDFDGDGKMDYAILVSHRKDRKKGIAIWLSSRPKPGLAIIGAGTLLRAGGGESDDWDFFDAWQVYGKRSIARGVGEGPPPKLIGEAILIERSEAASGLLYWNGSRFRWYQQGD